MSTQQKSAVYELAVVLATLVLYMVLRAKVGARAAPAASALLALVGFVPMLFLGEGIDERERHIARRASLLGFGASYLAMIMLSMGLWFRQWLLGEATVRIELLPLIVLGAFVAMLVVRAAAVLLLAPRAWDVAE